MGCNSCLPSIIMAKVLNAKKLMYLLFLFNWNIFLDILDIFRSTVIVFDLEQDVMTAGVCIFVLLA